MDTIIPKAAEGTIDGVPVTDAHSAAWAAEAEAGCDAAALKQRGRGCPGRGAAALQVVPVRLTEEELAALDASATPAPASSAML
ncbi:CopG family transcriptional regulator [Rathayibacter iranicus]|uniref:CopG family transcriptional regulator n=2 Tax=Rathayibacter iranicus TaxID=59737 RepID=A0AAD1ELN9_9MICO|nr:CopG family transcriptional regulator [Rathayibacter iranicus]MWV30493.1 CopG family transcriptional regulator [Rathayibacter iranicus NCPPB 2253 = VKM Ac-1602]PPI51066.1 CopG family transcriptional regulator [Rathayibacter iranicus]PPI63123.1 CopG family transcriptional regulator [Rathayibacter iranicus]PPI74193.1 CopG family transcriptional regulator [Rathayibacter iranicus]